ncbi:DNA repair protein RecO [uncultured delta proteobacterium]|uniref:DNA repair protein RecO n=1 Tax=uncultured delta proteobacterium TaxID=34034 RepID=A0A212J1P4_9DELT|nr:DNA repair protein RecO [uncultured delta proteobacterium]
MEFTDKVLILRVGRFRETDLWVRFLSPKRGLMSAFAFGGSRSRRRFSGCLDLFNEVLFSVKTTRNGLYNALQEGVLIRAPRKLRDDWRRLGIAVNCAKFVEAFGIAPDSAEKAHAALSHTLEFLEGDTGPLPSFPVLFRAKIAFEQGYALDLVRCSRCGTALADFSHAGFSVREGGFSCASCMRREREGKFLFVGHETLDALAHVQEYSPLHWSEGAMESLSPRGQRDFAQIVDAFIEHHVGLRWHNNRFIRV